MLRPEDLAYQQSCRRYAAAELVEIEKKYGEINEVPDQLRRSMATAGLFKHLIPVEYGGDGVSASGLGSDDAWDSGRLGSGESYKHQLTTGGTYTYQDGDNPGITGQLIVRTKVYLPVILRDSQ